MKKKKEKPRIQTTGTAAALGSLADVLRRAGITPSDATAPSASPGGDLPASKKIPEIARPKRLLIRCERKQRGGKTVTLVEGLSEDATELEVLLKRIKTALGCGGTVENGVLVLQGNIADRVRAWIEINT